MPDEESEKEILSGLENISEYLGVSSNTVKRLIHEEGLPAAKKGKKYFADREKLKKWLSNDEDLECEPESEEPDVASTLEPKHQNTAFTKPYLAPVFIALVALIILAAWQSWPNHGSPTKAVFEDHILKVLNKEGGVVWEKFFPEAATRGNSPEPLLKDVDGDGLNEILFNYVPSQSRSRSGYLICLDKNGEEKWTFHFGREVRVGDREFKPVYHAEQIHWIEEGPYVLAVARQAIWYPAQVVLLNPTTGELISEYWHPGYFKAVALWDADGDGVDELLLGGTNNPGHGYGHAALAVLDIPFTEKSGESTGFFDVGDSREAAYLLFPRFDVQDAAEEGVMVHDILVRDDHVVLGIGRWPSKYVYYYLGRNLELLDVRPSDGFIQEHNRLFQEGLLDHRYQPAEAESWAQALRFPTAPNANSPEIKAQFQRIEGAPQEPPPLPATEHVAWQTGNKRQ